ncbi:hypothetical protein P3X46_032307 [Hevea brasiliensis]|uniref:Peptidase metallopeptidase domain-containing protein n=1 Tax=Hevea brasiliensis TaxID=3981 RepID=A0ABQ9KCW9_HEVBR|nr:hypothetical protein P3X46_032307 [Hevea brasiliensis]
MIILQAICLLTGHRAYFISGFTSLTAGIWNPAQFWRIITNQPQTFSAGRSKTSQILDPALRFIHRLMASTILGRGTSSGASEGHEGKTLKFVQSLKDVQKGQNVVGLNVVKKHLRKFGYNPKVTGSLDSATIKNMMIPRCGVPDITNLTSSSKPTSSSHHKSKMFHMVSCYAFPKGMPRRPSSKYQLTYTFRSGVQNPNEADMRSACSRAFQRWASVSQFTFHEVPTGSRADIVIGFYRGDHGDGNAFDGRKAIGNLLAHAFYPQDGKFHYDADDDWSSNPNKNKFDLESVAVHEIGHLLGLEHSQDSNAIMYANIPPGTFKRKLTQDDIAGIHALYPN